MQLSSTDFNNGERIPSQFTCDGGDKTPSLHIKDVPSAAAALTLVVYDPDAPSGDFVHWLVWDLPASTKLLPPLPSIAKEGLTDFGRTGWGGPCPHSGEHRYIFTLTALGAPLTLAAGSDKAAFRAALAKYPILATATITGRYARP